MAKSHESSKGLGGTMKHLNKMHKGHADHQRVHGSNAHSMGGVLEGKEMKSSNTSELASMHTRKTADTTPSKPC